MAGTGSPLCKGDPSYGDFDMVFGVFGDHLSRISQLRPTSHAPCATLYLVPMLIELVQGI